MPVESVMPAASVIVNPVVLRSLRLHVIAGVPDCMKCNSRATVRYGNLRARHLGVKFDADPAQSFGEELGLAAQPDAQKAFEPEMRAGHDQHALIQSDALAELEARR